MTGHFVHPFDDDRFIAGNATRAWRFSKICPTSMRSSRRSAAADCSSGIARRHARLRPETRIFAAEPETAAPLAASLAAGRPVYFDNWTASFVDGAGGKSVLRRCGRCYRPSRDPSSSRSTKSARAMKLIAERAHVIAEGAAGCAIAAALSGRAGTRKVVAVVSGGNIDLSKFASLVGACDNRLNRHIVNHQ